MPKMNKGKLWVAGLSLFLGGLLVGAVFSRVLMKPPHLGFPPVPPPPGVRIEQMILNHLSDELDLTTDQREAIAPLVADMHAKMVKLKRRTAPEEMDLFMRNKKAIGNHLTAAQRDKHDRITQKFLELRDRMLELPKEKTP